MAISAKFQADFSDFHTEAAKADAEMGKLAQSTEEVNKALGGMSNTQTRATSTSNSAVTALRQFDGVLNAVGTNINSQIRAIDDLAAASGKTASQIGALGTAGLVAGAAMAGWDLGRRIADWAGLDDVISRGAATLLGWGDVSAETAGAKADVLAKASAAAGREITDLTEAMQINTQHAQEQADHFAAVASGFGMAEAASKALREELGSYLDRMDKVNATEDRITAARIKRNQDELTRFTEKISEIEHGGDHAFSTLHQWYGEMAHDQKRANDLSDQNIQKFEAAQKAAQQFLIDALNTALAIDAELAASPIGHGPTTPNGQGPPPIVIPPINVGSVFHQNTNTTLPARAGGGPVSAGQAYMVGERGPEPFIPNTNGTILPSGSGGPQVIQLVVSDRVLAEVVNDYNTKNTRRFRQLPAA